MFYCTQTEAACGDYSYRDCSKSYVLEQLAYLGCKDMGPGCAPAEQQTKGGPLGVGFLSRLIFSDSPSNPHSQVDLGIPVLSLFFAI